MEDSTAKQQQVEENKNVPPTVITVDTKVKEKDEDQVEKEGEENDDNESHEDRPKTNPETETRTPKHANTSLTATTVDEETETSEKDDSKEPPSSSTTTSGEKDPSKTTDSPQGSRFFAPRPYEGNIGGPTGAFQPRERLQQQHNQLMAMQHGSPGTDHYYANYHGPPPPQYTPGYDPQQRGGPHDYPPSPGHPTPYGNQHMYPPQQYHHGSYQHRSGPPPGWGPPSSYHGRPPPNYHHHPNQQHPNVPQGYHGSPPNNGSSTFSRAVSSSFDRSVKSREQGTSKVELPPQVLGGPSHTMAPPPSGQGDDRSVSDDGSWRQLDQIQSVDEDEIRKRLAAKRSTPKNQKESEEKRPASNSSSLTNSPTEGVDSNELKKESLPGPPKMTSSLDELSSVASAQQPLALKNQELSKDEKPLSPTDSAAASLDLMKCESGSSNLLLPSHQRSLSQFSFEGSGAKRSLEEAQDDSTGERPSKKGRAPEGSNDKKGSPLSITCSPPSAHAESKEGDKPYSFAPTSKDSMFDKPPMYSYSIDSAPAMPREENRGSEVDDSAFLSLPPRSHASAASPPPPIVGDTGNDRHPGVTQLPSWEIQGQDSFGGGSTTNALVGTFSFAQDYPMLSRNNSMMSHPMEPSMPPKHPGAPPMHHHLHHHMHDRHLESRNQSFEGGYYHGSFSRADSMSFESRSKGVPDARQGYHQPHYPPHAPSWGSQGSYAPPPPPPPHYSHSPPYRMHLHPAMMRTFSHESGTGFPPNFQPPSEFQAPPTNLNKNRPRTEKHIMTTPFTPSKSGVFGWTKEEDMRLTEIMKKHKNPRDWEPIAKELGRSRNAKECHERWIRYLKPGVRKGQWTDQEDAIVMEAVTNSKEQPFTRWSDLAQRLPGRVGKQIRDRWVNHLNPNINHLPFSRDDDLLLWEGHQKLGKRWVEISTTFFKSTRSENHIKNRWYSASFKKFIANEFGPNAYIGSKPGRPVSKKDSAKKKSSKSGAIPNSSDDIATTAVGI